MQFKSYAGFRKHLTRFHFGGVASSSANISLQHQQAPNPDEAVSLVVSDTEQRSDNDASLQDCSSVSRDGSREMCASIIAKLQGNGVANSLIMSVVESMEDFVDDFHTSLRERILNVVPVDSTSRSSVDEVFNSFHNPFSDFNTDTKWRKYFSEKWGVVEPIEMHLGVRYDSRRNKISGMFEQIPVNDTFIYIYPSSEDSCSFLGMMKCVISFKGNSKVICIEIFVMDSITKTIHCTPSIVGITSDPNLL